MKKLYKKYIHKNVFKIKFRTVEEKIKAALAKQKESYYGNKSA